MNIPKEMLRMVHEVSEYNEAFPKEAVARITQAMGSVDRKLFAPNELKGSAYNDSAMPIGEGQTISQPSTVARMLLLAGIGKGNDVLEIGAGSGWNAALISYIVYPGKVTAVERIPILANYAKKNIDRLIESLKTPEKKRLKRLEVTSGNALDKKDPLWKKKYDRIIITAGIEMNDSKTEKTIENMASQLLKDKGVLICPQTVGPLLIFRKDKKIKKERTREEYVFVPLMYEAK